MRRYDLYLTTVFKTSLTCEKYVLYIKQLSCIVKHKIGLHHVRCGVLLAVKVKCGLCFILMRFGKDKRLVGVFFLF